MRYAVRLINNPRPNPIFVEATEFHALGQAGGITFFAERMRETGGVDQWGNPRRQRQRVSVAFFNNVESVLEMPEEDPGLPEVGLEGAVPFNMGGTFAEPQAWVDEAPTEWGRLNNTFEQVRPRGARALGGAAQAIPATAPAVDDDGVNWDAERTE